MVKMLFPNDKAEKAGQESAKEQDVTASKSPGVEAAPDAKTAQKPDLAASTIGAYGEKANKKIDLEKAWKDAASDKKNLPWMNDPKSRLAVRAFSRGVVGAIFFTAGGYISRKSMRGYDVTKGLGEQKSTLQYIAKLIDTVVGAPIEATVKAVTGDAVKAKNAVLFRPTYYSSKLQIGDQKMWGRSLGHEVVDITFDFFCASVGDAWGRDIAGFFDPNVKKTWIDDKGHVDFPEAIKKTLKSVTRYVTYNGGEDWAVAIPYAYFMKAQCGIINHFSPGWQYDFDQAKNGGSFKLGGNPLMPDGKTVRREHKPTITGTYALEGAMDLQSRFTVYNIGTLMYRELYDYVGNRMHGHTDHLYGDPSRPDEHRGVLAGIGDMVKWGARSVIKGVIIMTPAVPFFWATRVSQHKHRGLFIHKDHGMLSRKMNDDPNNHYNVPIEVADYHHNRELMGKDVYYSRFDREANAVKNVPYVRVGPMDPQYANPGTWLDPTDAKKIGLEGTSFHPYREGNGISDRAFNAIGRAQHKIAKQLNPLATWVDNKGGKFGVKIKDTLGFEKVRFSEKTPDKRQSFKRFTHPLARAAISYTPYMYAKAEFANLWDYGKMDMAAERLVDGAFKLNWKEVKAGTGEVVNAIMHKQMAEPEREIEAQHRIEVDTSAPEIFSDIQFAKQKRLEAEAHAKTENNALHVKRLETEGYKSPSSNWRERVIQGKAEDKPEIGANRPKSYKEQEEMRKALEEFTPPTNSIN